MLARAFCSLLPDLDNEESLEVAALHSLRGALRQRRPLRPALPSAHPSLRLAAGLVGGGSGLARPGQISLAHHGVQLTHQS
jgi:magnesium chelatase family protein